MAEAMDFNVDEFGLLMWPEGGEAVVPAELPAWLAVGAPVYYQPSKTSQVVGGVVEFNWPKAPWESHYSVTVECFSHGHSWSVGTTSAALIAMPGEPNESVQARRAEEGQLQREQKRQQRVHGAGQ